MIVDTSAIVAILRDEPDAGDLVAALAGDPAPLLSAASYVEAAIVIDANRDPILSARFDDLLAIANITVEPVTAQHADLARQAYRNYGKGSGHRAALNFGDCFSYALARATGGRLLFKGDDFTHTDVLPAP